MYVNHSIKLAEPRFDIEISPMADEIRIFILPKEYGHISVYLSVAEAESLAFHLSAVVQELLTSREENLA